MTTTVANVVCSYTSTTITSTLSDVTVVELVVIATPASTCPVGTVTAENSVCSLTTTTSLIATNVNDVVSTVYEEYVLTPPGTCNLIYTTEPADDCKYYTYTRFIGTTDSAGGYINATLVVDETPDSALCQFSNDKSTGLPSITIPSISLSSSSPATPTPTPTPTPTKPTVPTTATKTYTKLETITSCSDHHCNGAGHEADANEDSGDRDHATRDGSGDHGGHGGQGGPGDNGGHGGSAPAPTAAEPSKGSTPGRGPTGAAPDHGDRTGGGAPSRPAVPSASITPDQPLFEYPTGSGSRLGLKDSYVIALVIIAVLFI